jgi:hypothetical protein
VRSLSFERFSTTFSRRTSREPRRAVEECGGMTSAPGGNEARGRQHRDTNCESPALSAHPCPS